MPRKNAFWMGGGESIVFETLLANVEESLCKFAVLV